VEKGRGGVRGESGGNRGGTWGVEGLGGDGRTKGGNTKWGLGGVRRWCTGCGEERDKGRGWEGVGLGWSRREGVSKGLRG